MKKLLKKQGFAPSRVVTGKLRSYASAFLENRERRRLITGPCHPILSCEVYVTKPS